MSQFKPGDLALVIGSCGRKPELVGTVVTLLECWDFKHGVRRGERGWFVAEVKEWSVTLERHLMPLKGGFVPEQQKSRELVK